MTNPRLPLPRPRLLAIRTAALSLIIPGAPFTAAHAGVLYNEPLQGDLSDSYLAPTPFALAPGFSDFFGACEGNPPDAPEDFDRDYFSVTIPAGHELAALTLGFYESENFAAFLGLSSGPVFSVSPDAAIDTDPLGWTLISAQEIGTDILPLLGAHGRTFTPPLAAGTYTFWAQQMGEYTEYALTFEVAPVPGPQSCALTLAAAIPLMSRRRGTTRPSLRPHSAGPHTPRHRQGV